MFYMVMKPYFRNYFVNLWVEVYGVGIGIHSGSSPVIEESDTPKMKRDMKFKTNAKCDGCRQKILKAVGAAFPDAQLSMELESADKVLEVHGVPEDAATAAQIVKTINETGFKGDWLQHTGY